MRNIDLDLIKEIVSDEEFAECTGDAMALNFFKDPQPLSEYNDEEFDGDCTFSEDGIVFADDGGGGFYILLDDGSIGYASPRFDECGRPAQNLRDFLELMLNTRYAWQNYMERRFLDKPELVKNYVKEWEEKGCEDFSDVYGDKYPSYDELIKKVGKRFDLRISEDISEDVLPKLYKSIMHEPEFTVIMDGDYPLETIGKS